MIQVKTFYKNKRNDIASCQEITIKIETSMKLGNEYSYFGGDHYYNFECEEFQSLKNRYRNDTEFNIYGSVYNMKMSYDFKTDKKIISLTH